MHDGPSEPGRAVVLFDGRCGLCDRSVDFILRRDRRARFRFAPLESRAARALLVELGEEDPGALVGGAGVDAPGSLLLIEDGSLFRESEAVLRIAGGLGPPWSAAAGLRLLPRALRDPAYRWVARRRYRWFGRRSSCRLPTAEQASRFLEDPEPGEAAKK